MRPHAYDRVKERLHNGLRGPKARPTDLQIYETNGQTHKTDAQTHQTDGQIHKSDRQIHQTEGRIILIKGSECEYSCQSYNGLTDRQTYQQT